MQWLLTQAGADGLQLTQDGYLKPAVVRQAVSELGWDYRWPGAASRESQTPPVLVLRQQLQAWKLLRKSKGRLVLSPAGRKMHDGGRPLGLPRHRGGLPGGRGDGPGDPHRGPLAV
ncbi:hypothetical protein PJ267_08805 [Arthrobacter sp. OVS8]|nr:hypothetical protein PJ267_08805 [Arthrobacter sp. OVS8]